MSESTNSTLPASAFSFQVPNLGNGFVELAMLTTLVGPVAAETLALGRHGAAGLAWATMSAFGIGRVISVCLSAACASWLREILGLRSKVIDSSLGMELSSKANSNIMNIIRKRYAAEGPLALSVNSRETQADGKLAWKEFYAFDDQTSRVIKNIPETWSNLNSPGVSPHKELSVNSRRSFSSSSTSIRNNKSSSTPTATISGSEDITLSVYTYPPYKYYRHHHTKFQLSMLVLSTIKVGECITLGWLSRDPYLSMATGIPWLYFFIVAVIVEVNDIRNTTIQQDHDTGVDMLSGQLPRMAHAGAGGTPKIILGISQNVRNSTGWKIMWAIGVLVCLFNVIFTYMALSHESNQILSIWVSFQILWTFVRVIVHHFAEPMNNSVERIVTERPWKTLPSSLKSRVLNLMSALGCYLTSVHPRREIAYRTTTVAPEELRIIIFHTSSRLNYPLPQDINPVDVRQRAQNELIEIEINAVIGDPILSSAAWIAGTHHTPTDLYDCCIISFRICSGRPNSLPDIITIPCARVLSGIPLFLKTQIDNHDGTFPPSGPRQFVPKHTANLNAGGCWCFFIPCEQGRWLFFRRNMTEDVVGKHTAEIMTDLQVTAMLAEGDMNISLSSVDDIQQIVHLSEQVRQILLQILVP